MSDHPYVSSLKLLNGFQWHLVLVAGEEMWSYTKSCHVNLILIRISSV